MLLQFSVENFRSIKEKAVLSMEASADKNLLENCIKYDGGNALKIASIFGANASGKSNIFRALTAGILTVRYSNSMQVGTPLSWINPFRFDEKCRNSPSKFEFVFVTNNTKYVYKFSATKEKIYSECLYAYRTQKPITIFEREFDNYTFTIPAIKSKLNPIVSKTTSNKLFLATSAGWNCEDTKEPLLWFFNGINTYDVDSRRINDMSCNLIENDKDGSTKKFIIDILHEADINISDFEYESKELKNNINNPFFSANGIVPKEFKITTSHMVENEKGEKELYKLDITDESTGTTGLFFFAPFIKRAFDTGETLCIDEFDTGLHPLLVSHLIDLFKDTSRNKKNAQLIISTHTVGLLDLNKFRRDQIYFVEKDEKTASSELYSLDEFSPRTSENIQKLYLLGRYGSVPNLI